MGNQILSICSCDNSEKMKKDYQTFPDKYESPEKSKSGHSRMDPSKIKESQILVKNFVESIMKGGESEIGTNCESACNEDFLSGRRSQSAIENIQYEDGAVYSGEILKGLRHGQGKLLYTNGNCYVGRFVEDIFEGYGKFREGDMLYEGMFIKGEKSGHGLQHNRDNSYKYEGDWKFNLKNGQGTENYPDGSVYEGFFVNGKKQGKGKLTLANGSCYEGEFYMDKIEGYGFFKWSNGQAYKGNWKDNTPSGLGCFKKEDKIYKGYFYNGKKHGYGINTFLKTNTSILGCWSDNSIEGLAIYISTEKEALWKMKKNKITKTIENESEIENLKKTEEFEKLQNFYTMINSQTDKDYSIFS